MLDLDIRTLALLTIFSGLLLAAALELVKRVIADDPSLRIWSLGATITSVGFIVIALRGLIPDQIPFIVANTLFVCGSVWLYLGSRRFLSLPSELPWYWILTGVSASLFVLFTILMPSVRGRIVTLSLATGIVAFANAYVFLCSRDRQTRLVCGFVGLAFLVTGTLFCLRGAIVPFMDGIEQDYLLRSQPIHTLAFLSRIGLYIVLCACLPVLVAEKMRRRLATSEQNYSEIFNSVNDAIFIHDAETGLILDVNDTLLRIYGYKDKSEIINLHPDDMGYGESPYGREEATEWMRKAMTEGPQLFEWCARHHQTGKPLWTEVALQSALINGQPRVLAVVRDTTERKRIDDQLRRSEERYHSFVQHSHEAIYCTEFDEPISTRLPIEEQIDAIYRNAYMGECNQAMAGLYGFTSSSELVGKRLVDFHGGSDNQLNRATFRRFIESGYSKIDSEMEEVTPSGERRFFLSNDIGIVEADKLIRIWGTTIDITERKRLEELLTQRNMELQKLFKSDEVKSEAEKRRIARELHDDLGHRLTILRMDIEKLEARMVQGISAARACLPSIYAEFGEIVDAIRRICEELRPGMLDALGLPAAIDGYVRNFSERTGIPCELVLSHEDYQVNDDVAINIFRIVQESLNNAAKYAQAKSIRVTLKFADHDIALIVEDDGIGLPTIGPGTRIGFGLIGMRERVKSLNGSLSIASNPGQGVRIEAIVPN